MDEKTLFFSILCFCVILLPFAIMSWRTGNKRIYKHVLYWTIIMMMLFLIGKTIKGTLLPPEQPAHPRGALLMNTTQLVPHPAALYWFHELQG